MTNKQITIDGVNVSGCECFYINGSHPERKECINPYCKGLCKGNPNCHYKQLKRAENQIADLSKMVEIKEQELKNICKAFDIEYAIDEETGNLIGRCNKLYKKERECEKKSRIIGNLEYKIKNQRKEIDIRLEQLDQLKLENTKYEQTLTEIKEIADYSFSQSTSEYMAKLELILDKISEVEE